MLHFFRKIRRDLLANSQTIRYLKYGIGEIILVVIGILIALQIDNWNEQRKSREQTKILMEEVAQELAKNIRKSEIVIDYRLGVDSLFYKMLNKKLTYEDYKSDFFLHVNFPLNHRVAQLIDENFQKLIQGYSSFSPQSDTIVSALKDLYGNEKKYVDRQDALNADLANELKDKLKREIPSFSDFRNYKTSDELIAYCLTDEFYRNEVADIYFIGKIQLYHANVFRLKAIKAYEDVCDALSLPKNSSITRNLEDFEHYKGTYYRVIESDSYLVKIESTGEGQITFKAFKNDSLEVEALVHPYSDRHFLLSFDQDLSHSTMMQIHFDSDENVIGFSNIDDLDEIDGKRPMSKKIE